MSNPQPNVDKAGSIRALNALNFFLANVQTGVGPFLVVFLTMQLRWTPAQIGLVSGISGAVGVLGQVPAGGLIDGIRHKRGIIVVACTIVVAASLAMGYLPGFTVIVVAQSLIALCGTIFGPAIAAMTLGLCGRERLDRQVGRNQTFNSSGNVFNAVALGLCGYYSPRVGIFWFVAAMWPFAVFFVSRINSRHIDHGAARGSDRDPTDGPPDDEQCREDPRNEPAVTPIRDLFLDRRLLLFAAAAILFHFVTGGIGPLVSQVVAKEVGTRAMLYQSAMTIAAQVMVAALGWWIGKWATNARRKPIFVIGFAILLVRAILTLVVRSPNGLVGISTLDGAANGIFGVLQLLVIADLTKGTGRFNLAQGAIATAVGVGASLASIVAGFIVRAAGFSAGFGTMAVFAAVALVFFWWFMPETKLDRATPDSPPTRSAYVA